MEQNGGGWMETLRIIQKMVWGPWLLGLFLAVGALCMVRLRGFPLLHIRAWWRETVGSGGKKQLLTTCTALAATVGTGNITGVAAALAIGGPGAVFWMWAAAFMGIALAYTEVYLGILYRKEKAGEMGGRGAECGLRAEGERALENGAAGFWTGPYVYLEEGIGSRLAGNAYALFCVLASLGMGCMVQAGSLADSLRYAASLPPLGAGLILAFLTAVVLFGGAKRIGQTASVLVPVSAGLYLLAGGIAVLSFYDRLPGVVGRIVSGAFGLSGNTGCIGNPNGNGASNFSSISGGVAGYGLTAAIRSGISRGVFSNEAGLGSLAVLHGMSGKNEGQERKKQEAEARKIDRKARQQGMWAIFEVFFDTIAGCSVTAFLLLCVFPYNLKEKVASFGGSGAVAAALAVRFGDAGGGVTAACMVLFAFATILAWFYIGEQALEWLVRELPGTCADVSRILYHGLYLAAVFLGCISQMEAVWAVSDIFNGLMAVPNLAALVLLGNCVKRPEIGQRMTGHVRANGNR